MKNFSRSLAGLAIALAATTSFAQTSPSTMFPHDKAVEAATYLARQKIYAAKCPFSDRAKAALDRLQAMATPVLGLTPSELTAIDTDTHAAALELIKEPRVKRITCPILEAALRRQTEQVLAQKAAAPVN